MKTLQLFTVLTALDHDNKPYAVGEPIELTAAQAKDLKDCQAIKPAGPEQAGEASASQTSAPSQQLADMKQAADQYAARILVLDGQLAARTAQIAELQAALNKVQPELQQGAADREALAVARSDIASKAQVIATLEAKATELAASLQAAEDKLATAPPKPGKTGSK